MATVVNFIDTTLQAAATRTVALPTSRIKLDPSAPLFKVAADGTITPASITLIASFIDLDPVPLTFNVTGGKLTSIAAAAATLVGTDMTGTSATVIASATIDGTVYTAPCTITKVFDGATGADGQRSVPVQLQKWSATAPAKPTGTSTLTWSTMTNGAYTGSDGWAVSADNPGTPGLKLYIAAVMVSAAASAATTTVSYANATVAAWSQNGATGASGAQTRPATVYQWAATIPEGPTGSGSFKWSDSTFGAAPAGWSLLAGAAPSPGMTLWAASVQVTDTATNSTTAFQWSTASIMAIGYAGNNGQQGASYVTAYIASSAIAANGAPAQTSGKASLPAANSSGLSGAWSATVPTLADGQRMYQSDGIYDPATDKVTWSTPYWSSLKVATLSAITLGVMGAITSGSFNIGNGVARIDADGTAVFRAIELQNADGSTFLKAGKLAVSAAPTETLNSALVPAISAAATNTFTALSTWNFDSTTEGWYGGNGANFTNTGAGTGRLTSGNTDPMLYSPALSFSGGVYDKIRIRLRRLAGSGWDGQVFFNREGTDGNGVLADPNLALNVWTTIEFDMYGRGNWSGISIDHVRIDLGATAADIFEIDWIAIGRYAPAPSITDVQNAATTADWTKVSGSGKPADGATVGAPSGTLVAGVAASTVATAATNFNSSNDRNGTAVTNPAIAADGTAVDHIIRTDGAADISFEWVWGGAEGDIDGFLVHVYQSTSSAAYTFGTTPAAETVYTVPASKRAFILFGAGATMYTTFGVQAYRSVDKDISSTGVIRSSMVRPSVAAENPYRPSNSVAFTGDITGTISGMAASTLLSNVAAAATTAQYDLVSGRFEDPSNIVKKASFEDNAVGGWTGAQGVEAISGTNAAVVPYAKQLVCRARDTIETNNYFKVTSGETLYFGTWLNTEATTLQTSFGVIFYDKNGQFAGTLGVPYQSANQGWRYVSGSGAVPSNAATAVPWLWENGSGSDFNSGNWLRAAGMWIGRHELGATAGAVAGQNLKSAGGAVISDADMLNSYVKVGGTNLQQDSSFEKGRLALSERAGPFGTLTLFNSGYQGFPSRDGGKYLFMDGNNGTGSVTDFYVYLGGPKVKVIPGVTYTISFYHKSATGSSFESSSFFRQSDGNHVFMPMVMGNQGEWMRHVQYWTCPAGVTTIEMRFGAQARGYWWMAIDQIKIEEGNKDTGWTPAPEDAEISLADKLSASSASILKAPITLTTGGGVVVGSLTYNPNDGTRTGGSGVALTPFGLLCHNGNGYAFTLSASGDAAFAGTLSGAGGSFGNVTVASGGSLAIGQSGYDSGTGFWLGWVGGVPKMSIGTAGGSAVLWDGTGITIRNPSMDSFTAYLSGSAGGSYANGSQGYGTLTVNTAGGKAPYRYQWVLSLVQKSGSAGNMVMNSATSQSASFSGSGTNASLDYAVSVVVTDANGRSYTLSTEIVANHGTPP